MLVSQTSASAKHTEFLTTVGPATIFIGDEQTVEYHVVSGQIDSTTLVTTTTTVHQTWQATAAGAPCANTVAAPIVAPSAITAAPVFTG